jgi:hypothetical protein
VAEQKRIGTAGQVGIRLIAADRYRPAAERLGWSAGVCGTSGVRHRGATASPARRVQSERKRESQVVHKILLLGPIHSLPAVLLPNTVSSG